MAKQALAWPALQRKRRSPGQKICTIVPATSASSMAACSNLRMEDCSGKTTPKPKPTGLQFRNGRQLPQRLTRRNLREASVVVDVFRSQLDLPPFQTNNFV